MDYNQKITTDLVPIIERILRMVDRYSEFYKISDIKISVDDSDLSDLGAYVSTGTTCEFRIDVNYLLEGETTYRYFYLTVPRMIDGIFIINGKYKMLSRKIGEDDTCRRVGKYFRISYKFSYDLEANLFGVYDDEEDDFYQVTFEELAETYPEKLVLNERQGNKLKVKLNLPERPKKLTKELVSRFHEIPNNPNDILDKRIISIESVLIKTLRENMLEIVRQLNHNFYNKGTIAPGTIQKFINGTFNGQMSSVNTTVSSANVNPLSFDSTNEKITIDNESFPQLSPGNYDISMADIIDPVFTPDNANINKINHLNHCASVKDGWIAIKCYDKNFNPVEVDFVEYVASRVLVAEEVTDYENRIIPKKDSYKVKINREYTTSKEYDFIEPSADDRLSSSTRMIPMLNEVDSVRGSMAAKMMGQAVPLSSPDTPRVMSGHEGDNSLSTTDIKFESTLEGTVIKSDNNSVIVMVEGIPKEYKVPSPAVGIYDITAVFSPKVKVGDIVRKGDTLITHDISKGGTRNLGVNALVALRPYRGYNYEDGIVISKSFARRLNHYSIIDLTFLASDRNTILSLLPIGSKVTAKDILVSSIKPMKNEITENLSKLLSPTDKSLSKEDNLVTPNNVEEGYVTDVKIFYNDYVEEVDGKAVNQLNPSSITVLEKFKRNRAVLPDNIPAEYRAQLPTEYDYEGYACCIRYRILTLNPAIVGTKLANRYGSKGLVAIVLEDEEMDKTIDGRVIDCIINSDAVIARKNIAQIPEVFLSIVADAIKAKVATMPISEAKSYLASHKLTNYSSLPDEELKSILEGTQKLNYITGCFSKISIEEILKWCEELEIDTAGTAIIDGKTKRPVRNKVLVGSMYMMKLYQLPEHYNKVHAEGSEEDPILGKGLYREGEGQSQGGLETYSLFASDLDQYVYATRKKHEFQDAEGLMINLRLAGVNIRIEEV